ncbi:hypothetical protein AWV80_27275 [Cupriavidus sp. UYMU48A]|nr:hypothetical protein AWV80_27275 [Cupriavidus sp. UYMU48A]
MTDTLAPRMSAVAVPATGNSPPLPQCLAAHVLRPPGLRWAGGEPLVARLLGAERDAAAATPGVRAVIVRNNFAGVVADSDEDDSEMCRSLLSGHRLLHSAGIVAHRRKIYDSSTSTAFVCLLACRYLSPLCHTLEQRWFYTTSLGCFAYGHPSVVSNEW